MQFTVYRWLPQASCLALIGLMDHDALKNLWPEAETIAPILPYKVDNSQKIIAFDAEHPAMVSHGGENPLDYKMWTCCIENDPQHVGSFEAVKDWLVGMVQEAPDDTAVSFHIRRATWPEMLEMLEGCF